MYAVQYLFSHLLAVRGAQENYGGASTNINLQSDQEKEIDTKRG